MKHQGRTRGFTVALVGPDGAGKTTVAAAVADRLEMPSTYLYMGVSQGSANKVLPITRIVRWVRRRRGTIESGPASPNDRPAPATAKSQARAFARTINRMAEETYRQVLASRAVRRGEVVLFDRHFFADYYSTDVAGSPDTLARQLHGWFLRRVLPRPDSIIMLDAPAEVLFARKGEGTVEILESLRQGYLSLEGAVASFTVVGADQPLEAVVDEVLRLISDEADRSSGETTQRNS